jgi:hypothetical protein
MLKTLQDVQRQLADLQQQLVRERDAASAGPFPRDPPQRDPPVGPPPVGPPPEGQASNEREDVRFLLDRYRTNQYFRTLGNPEKQYPRDLGLQMEEYRDLIAEILIKYRSLRNNLELLDKEVELLFFRRYQQISRGGGGGGGGGA